MSKPAIVFIGFMGAGKSTALRAARAAGLEVTEIDELMEREFGSSIREAFETHGEEGFRAREAEVVGALLENADGGAIALGGGSILSERVRAALDRHIVVWLEIDAAEAWRRIENSNRPLAKSEEDVTRLLEVRLPLYEELADAVVPMADREVIERALPWIQTLAELPEGTKLLWATSAAGEYPVYVGRGLLERWWLPLRGRSFWVGDSTTMELFGPDEDADDPRAVFAAGEHSKTIETATAILEEMVGAKLTRQDHLVAVGGGVVGDVAGLCAHLYQRGIPVVQVPTTLVAQVDSAYGGKTGVDLGSAKNYVGAYHLPAAVITDTTTLRTLPRRELAAGFVEVIKTALLAGGALWPRVRSIGALDPDELDDVVFACARYKCGVVAADERDAGLRHVLNLGHTVGHAIEGATSYSVFSHGEAVGLGLLAALRLSGAPELKGEVEAQLARLDLPVRIPQSVGVMPQQILDVAQYDKKRTAAGVGFVLLSEPGAPRTGEIIPEDEVRAAVEELYE